MAQGEEPRRPGGDRRLRRSRWELKPPSGWEWSIARATTCPSSIATPPFPVSRVERVSTLHANQTEGQDQVFQGESRKVKDNLLLGEFLVKGIPRGPAGQGD